MPSRRRKTKSNACKVLSHGDTIDIIAPASTPSREILNGGVKALKSKGFRPRYDKGIISKNSPYMSNTDANRLRQLYKSLKAKDSSMVWCVRGGYGAIRLLPYLKKLRRPKTPKILMGYSDITSLHVFLTQKWNWISFHGPQFDRLGTGRLTKSQEKEVFNTLMGWQEEVEFKNLKPMNTLAKKNKTLKGTVIGGNMVVLQSTLGTEWQVDCRGKILFLEEIDERGYRVDRILEHLVQAGALKGCLAIVFGDFVGGEEPNGKNYSWYAAQKFAERVKIPMFSGMKTGHGLNQRVLPMNTPAVLKTGKVGNLKVKTGIHG